MSSEPGGRSFEPGARSFEPGAPSSGTSTQQVRSGRVWVAAVREPDIAPYRRAVEQSRRRLARWNPVDPDDLARSLKLQAPNRRTYLIHAHATEGEHDLVGKVNVSDVVRGRFESAAIGYDAYDPYAGRGLFSEGLRLILDLLFTSQDSGGMGLHRVQAAVQPGNVRSAGLLRSLGFQREGFSPRLLWLPGADGNEAWRDHDSYVLIRDEWPAHPYPAARGRRIVVLVNRAQCPSSVSSAPGSGTVTLARQLAAELRVPLLSREVAGSDRALWALLADSPAGGVVESSFGPDDADAVLEGLRSCRLDPAAVPEVRCFSGEQEASGLPLGLGSLLEVDLSRGVEPAEVVRIALEVGAVAASPASET